MAQDEIGGEHSKFRDLAEEFATRLRDGMPAHGIPFASPPSNVRGISLELSSEGEGDDELEEESLDGDDCDHAGQSLDETEAFQEEHDFEEGEKHDHSDSVSNSSQNSTELLAAHAE